MKRYLAGLLLGAALLAPLTAVAQDRRYYDRERRDYHAWNDGENRAYRRYLEEQHIRSRREFVRESRQRQRAYWVWRHSHPDTLLFPR